MANKKNKRLSSSSSSSSEASTSTNKQTDAIERTPENDYGVLSDPDEANELNQATSLATEEAEAEANRPAMPEQILAIIHELPDTQPHTPPYTPPYTPLIESQTPLSTILEPLHQTSQIAPDPEPMTATSTMDRLKLILSSDKKYEEKMTLHTFFSFVVMSMDLTSGGSVSETETLVEYLINHHSVNEYTKAYLHSLFETNVVKNIIQSILQFNNEHPDNFTKLVSAEKQQQATIVLTDVPPHPPPSRIHSFFKRIFCCCCARPRRRNSLLPSDTSIVLKDTEMTPVVQEDATQE